MHLPLTWWTLKGENLPERLMDEPKKPAFSLPGAQDLGAFADLLGTDGETQPDQAQGVSYALGGLFEEDLAGELTLSREIDFGALCGDRAVLTFAYLCGSGGIFLDEKQIAAFGEDRQEDIRHAAMLTGMPCSFAVDLTDALLLGKSQTLCVKFSAQRPAGVTGAAFLSVTSHAHLARVSVQPDALRRTMTVSARIIAQQAGSYVLHVQEIPGMYGREVPPARRTEVNGGSGEKGVKLSFAVDEPVFAAGQAYDAPALKIQLLSKTEKREKLLDEALLMCGYGAAAPRYFLPLTEQECTGDPKAICNALCELGIYCVSLPLPAPEALYMEMTRRGIAAVQHVPEEIRPLFTRYPCVSLCDAPLEEKALSPHAAAWQMAGSVAFPRTADRTVSDGELLYDVSGRALDAGSQGVVDALTWLRVVQIRMSAEAARQGRYQGAICCAGEWTNGEIRDALRTAFSPVHLSALPLSGAWWTGTRFSASLEVFLPEKMFWREPVYALAVLEDDEGNELARFFEPCRKSGYAGVIEAQLPDKPCVLTLRCALLRGGERIGESTLPVYVGERGPLEAAF